MNYYLTRFRSAFVFYVIAGGILSAVAPWMTGPFWVDWLGTVIGASICFWVFSLLQSAWVSFKKRKKT